MANWYCSRERLKTASNIAGAQFDALIDSYIEAASREIDRQFHRRFIPLTAVRSYPWPQRFGRSWVLYLDEDLISVSALTRTGTDVVAIASTDYFLEPSIFGPPYNKIEIDLASSAYFGSKDTHQRQILVTGLWGYKNDTVAAGALAEALDSSETGVDITNSALVDVGNTILCGTEAMFVSGKTLITTGSALNGNLTASKSEVSVTLTLNATPPIAGEIIQIDSEQMYVQSISGSVLTVERAYNGTVLAAHTGALVVYAFRTLTVTRGENGTTAAAHDTASALTTYAPPADIQNLCLAMAQGYRTQGSAGWAGVIGGGDQPVETSMRGLRQYFNDVKKTYARRLVAAV